MWYYHYQSLSVWKKRAKSSLKLLYGSEIGVSFTSKGLLSSMTSAEIGGYFFSDKIGKEIALNRNAMKKKIDAA